MNRAGAGPTPAAVASRASAAGRIDRDVLDALIDEAIESAVVRACASPVPRRAELPAAGRPAAGRADPWVVEALVDEVLEELAGHGACLPAPARRATCTG